MPKLGFIGAGKMGAAMISGIIAGNLVRPEDVGVYDADTAQMERFISIGCRAFSDAPSLVAGCNTVFLCVKPQTLPQIMPDVKQGIRPETLLVSIAAGITAGWIKDAVGFDCKIILAMPNTPMLLGVAAVALSREEPTTVEEFERVKALFNAVGIAEEIPPALMNEVIPVNASSPAFVYLFAKAIIDKAVQAGIDETAAKNLVAQTLIGSAHMLRDTGSSPQELIDMVCSPGGTTLAAMAELERLSFSDTLGAAFDACTRRARELSQM